MFFQDLPRRKQRGESDMLLSGREYEEVCMPARWIPSINIVSVLGQSAAEECGALFEPPSMAPKPHYLGSSARRQDGRAAAVASGPIASDARY